MSDPTLTQAGVKVIVERLTDEVLRAYARSVVRCVQLGMSHAEAMGTSLGALEGIVAATRDAYRKRIKG